MTSAVFDPRAELRGMLARFDDAMNRRDADLVASFFAEDATYADAFGAMVRGRELIGRTLAGVVAAEVAPEGEVHFELIGVRMLDETFAFADLSEEVSGLARPGGELGSVKLAVSAVFTRAAGEFMWLDARSHFWASRPT
jgi:uncharacterized protein (TIGR02246 family)